MQSAIFYPQMCTLHLSTMLQSLSYYPSCFVMGSLGLAISRALFFQLPPSPTPLLALFSLPWADDDQQAVWLFPSGDVWCLTHIKHRKEVWQREICFLNVVVLISHDALLMSIVHLVNSMVYNLVNLQFGGLTLFEYWIWILNILRLLLSGRGSNHSERTELIIISKVSGTQQVIGTDTLIEMLLQDLPLK